MENRVAVIAIIAESTESSEQINALLHEYGSFIIGRMGLPYEKKKISCITVVIDAAQNEINTLCGQIGRLEGISSKAAFSNV